jgi:AAA ATPase domain
MHRCRLAGSSWDSALQSLESRWVYATILAGGQSVDAVVGREEELGSLREFVAGSRAGAHALVLEGEAGIGKTTLWLASVEAARERSPRVLAARPAAAERGLAHAGLGDLLDDVLEEVLPALPAPRRQALEIALLLAEAEDRAPDARAVGVAVLTALRGLAEEGPLVVAVDDVQWLDASPAAGRDASGRSSARSSRNRTSSNGSSPPREVPIGLLRGQEPGRRRSGAKPGHVGSGNVRAADGRRRIERLGGARGYLVRRPRPK